VRWQFVRGFVNIPLTNAADVQKGTVGKQAAWTCRMVMSMPHTAWACSMSLSMGMQHEHGHEHEAWKWTCSIDMDLQHGHGHAAWTSTCSMDMDMQHGHGQAAWAVTWTWRWTCTMRMHMLLVGHRSTVLSCLWKLFFHFCRPFRMQAALAFSSTFISNDIWQLAFLLQGQCKNEMQKIFRHLGRYLEALLHFFWRGQNTAATL
jgi:hypothetical protein